MPTFQDIEYIRVLIAKFLRNELSEHENDDLQKWINASAYNKQLFEDLTGSDQLLQQLHEWVEEKDGKDAVWHSIQQKRQSQQGGSVITLFRVGMAAAILVAIGLVIFWIQARKETQPVIVQETRPVINDVAPGGFKARLTLADGRTVILDSAGAGKLAEQGNMAVVNKDGQLNYTPSTGGGRGEAVLYNTLTTGRGEIYSLSLSDGSRVWLNSASSIKYPVAFTGKDRGVEIKGEAYFEIAHNTTKPFKVTAGSMETEVLGTKFNINSYSDESMIRTTLLEGSIKVTPTGSAQGRVLKPGQQAQLATSDKAIKVTSGVDMEEVLAWKDGKFVFNNTELEVIMRQVERWYNVEVSYEDKVLQQEFTLTGEISRYNKVSQVLELLETTRLLHFTIEGRKITLKL